MNHSFSRTPTVTIPRAQMDRSHGHKTTFDASYLVPFFIDEALPGDTLNLKAHGFARMATPIFPVMDNIYLDTFFFSVPIRQIWNNWRKFCGEQEDPGDSIDYTIPTVTSTGSGVTGALPDYFGVPLVASLTHNCLPYRAYWHVINEWFRDQNLQDSMVVDKSDANNILTTVPDHYGQTTTGSLYPAKRGKRHDYFTSCLPWPLKGGVEVELPLGTSAPIHADADVATDFIKVVNDFDGVDYRLRDSGLNIQLASAASPTDAALYANLSTATAATINEFREAIQIQRLLERDARAGTRYSEIIQSHFGVQFVDVTYRPEYLGGGSTPINVNPVASTYDDGTQNTKGDLGAFATAQFNGHGFVKSFTEHCYVIGLVNVRADLTYQQGLNRMFSRSTRYDFYWPSLSQIGEQAVLNKEIFADGSANDDLVFGYQERYGEYRYKPSQISGLFRSDAASNIDEWHLSDDFASLPTLGHEFIVDSAETVIDRVCGTPSQHQFIADFYFDYKCVRPMPLYGTPGMIDHF